jgi:DNA (cytosine-5)-methyltransferase 1
VTAYYNEIDPRGAAWLRELIKQNLIASGEVDERSILDVPPGDLAGFTQCHFFAGIGVWSYALRCAGWPDDQPVWTGSCPCQPFSAAGKGGGIADERHLWPGFFHLIRVRRPDAVFGEQVSSKDGLTWFNHVRSDLEGEGYTVGVSDLCSAGFGAPHIRQRLHFVAHSGLPQRGTILAGRDDNNWNVALREEGTGRITERGLACPVVNPESVGLERGIDAPSARSGGGRRSAASIEGRGCVGGFWSDAEWLWGRDNKWRAVEPGTFPLAHGAAARVGRLRGYGNAIVAPVAEAFVRAYMDLLARA